MQYNTPNENSLKKEGVLKLPVHNSPLPNISKSEHTLEYLNKFTVAVFPLPKSKIENSTISPAEVEAVYFSIRKTIETQLARREELLCGK